MLNVKILAIDCVTATTTLLVSGSAIAEPAGLPNFRDVVDRVVMPLKEANKIPGIAVALTIEGKSHVFNYGIASERDGRVVDDRTLFEIGSVSKVFTGTLVAWVAARGKVSLSDPATRHMPELLGTDFDHINLLELATYTAGGLPLQFPDEVQGKKDIVAFYENWKPSFAPGTHRLYSNTSIGLFGYLAARGEGVPFESLMAETLLPKLGLSSTYLKVPEGEMVRYAYGTSKDDKQVRVSPGPLDAESYGIKTTAGDLIRFTQLALDSSSLDEPLQGAFAASQTGYYRFGQTLQGLGWEIYDGSVSLDTLLEGNAPSVALEPQAVEKLDPPLAPQRGRLVNKTGSTSGFGAYVAFLPEKRIGIAILANRNYPVLERVRAAHAILAAIQ